jgi:beta-barrel assembly-enhancing protease
MNRRRFVGRLIGTGLLLRSGGLLAAEEAAGFAVPLRFSRPENESDEGGLWAMMDREERNLKRSHLLLKDSKLRDYVQDLACRLGGEHCPDIRVHIVRTPVFNASMAPNGMMQVWSGLLLRVDNEAQLAAVLGHEIAHFLQRHSLERLRDLKSKAAFSQFLALFGAVGAIGQIAVIASAFSYGRDQEREADRIGAYLMHQAGYDVGEAAMVWGNLLDEARAREGKEPDQTSPLFATHPAPPERREVLGELAKSLSGGRRGAETYAAAVGSHIGQWMADEVKRGQYAESLVLFDRLVKRSEIGPLALFHRGEVYRLRGEQGDGDRALADYLSACSANSPPPEAFRGIGFVYRNRGQSNDAVRAFTQYLELAPNAPDAAFIQSYISELKS